MNPAYYLVAVAFLHGHLMNRYSPLEIIHSSPNNAQECEIQKLKAAREKWILSINANYSTRYICMTENRWISLAMKLQFGLRGH